MVLAKAGELGIGIGCVAVKSVLVPVAGAVVVAGGLVFWAAIMVGAEPG